MNLRQGLQSRYGQNPWGPIPCCVGVQETNSRTNSQTSIHCVHISNTDQHPLLLAVLINLELSSLNTNLPICRALLWSGLEPWIIGNSERPQHVLSPSSILPPPSSHCIFIPSGKNWGRLLKNIFFYIIFLFENCVRLKLLGTGGVCILLSTDIAL